MTLPAPRLIRSGDEPAILQLLHDSLRYDQLSDRLLREKIWGDARFDPELARVLVQSGEIVGFALAVVAPPRAYLKFLCVRADLRRQGLGRFMLADLENRFPVEVTGLRLDGAAPNYLWPGLNRAYGDAAHFFQAMGFVKVGETMNMTVVPAEKPVRPSLSVGYVLRRMQNRDKPCLDQLLARFWPGWSAELERVGSLDIPPVFVVFEGAVPVGFAAFDCNNVGSGWFGPLGVHPEHRNRGLGRALLLRCLGAMKTAGYQKVTIPWVSRPAYYARAVGARPSERFLILEKSLKR